MGITQTSTWPTSTQHNPPSSFPTHPDPAISLTHHHLNPPQATTPFLPQLPLSPGISIMVPSQRNDLQLGVKPLYPLKWRGFPCWTLAFLLLRWCCVVSCCWNCLSVCLIFIESYLKLLCTVQLRWKVTVHYHARFCSLVPVHKSWHTNI